MAVGAGDDRELSKNQCQRPATTSPPNTTMETAHESRDMVGIVPSVDLLKQDHSALTISIPPNRGIHL
jgi:hypothetical protein